MIVLKRPIKAYRRANQVILATPSGMEIISRYTSKKPIIITETGAYKLTETKFISKNSDKLSLTWVGLIAGRKALPIAIKSIANSKHKNQVILNVIGDGPNLNSCKKLVEELNLNTIFFHGNLSNTTAKQMIADSDMLFFTSVLDATSTVIFEALQTNTPVLCHDTCGFGSVINDTCGIKIPLLNPKKSISLFSEKIDYLVEHPKKMQELKDGCNQVIENYYWDEKAKKMNCIYEKCLK